ncbi:MAG: AAA family ATPase [Anaerolineae bacterium]|nr:AAA family ATPase [Anaerolineae bacterium]
MRVHGVRAQNYRPFASLEEMRLGRLATIVGQNDAGKSNVLRALQLFFETRPKIEDDDVHDGAGPDDDVVVELAFSSLPESIELEDGIETTLQEEMLVDRDGHLRIRKVYPRSNLSKFKIALITQDFVGDQFAGLAALKEKELNARCASVEIEVTKSGRGITNKSKREALHAKAREEGVELAERELPLTTNDDLWKRIASILPEFELFESDTRLGVGETTFQSQFRPIVKAAAEEDDVVGAKNAFTGAIGEALQAEVDNIFERLQRHTDAFAGLTVKPRFFWDKAVSFEIFGKDLDGVEKSLEQRGSGMRRLLMVAFFQYLAERSRERGGDFIFAVEEPENCLHPGVQRELAGSFRQLADEGYQIIVTSHSPVFAGASPIDDLALVKRTAGVATAIQTPDLVLSEVAAELGVEPADQITGYDACVFVEGPCDIFSWKTIAAKLKEGRHVDADFDDKNIGFVLTGGECLKHWIDLRAMGRLNKRFAVVIDSDRKGAEYAIPGRKLNWKSKCEAQGGLFFIVRKREIENYLHSEAIERSQRTVQPYDEFTDMKEAFGDNVYKVFADMSCDEILDMDCYAENGVEHHELKEIVEALLALPQTN